MKNSLLIFCAFIFSVGITYAQIPYLNGNYNFIADSLRIPLVKTGVPLITDLDRDGNKEIIIATVGTNVALHVIKSDMNEYSAFPKYYSDAIYDFSSGDVNGDGYIDIVLKFDNSITVIDRFGNNLPGFPVSYTNGSNGVFGVISLYDLDNDGKLEIITTRQNEIGVFNFNGLMRNGWTIAVIGFSAYGPALGDIDNDGLGEIIYSYNSATNGYINIFRHNGQLFPGN